MSFKNISIIVPGGLHTDIVAYGVNEIIGAGELSYGGELKIGPGGKSRNIAQMMAVLAGPEKVAMIGRTVQDPMGLWEPPVKALKEHQVNVEFVKIFPYKRNGKLPAVALIAVDKTGDNQIYVLPGVNENFCNSDINSALPLFKSAKNNNGILALTLEMPLKTAIHSIKVAKEYGLKCILDPGGIIKGHNYNKLLNQNIYLIKPNIHETEVLTGIKVEDMISAKRATKIFFKFGIQNVLITIGKKGAYFINNNISKYIKVPKADLSRKRDETGCGDQTTATLCVLLLRGEDILKSAEQAVLAGHLQQYKIGIKPVTNKEIEEFKLRITNYS
jgi:ribokinase